MNPSASTNLFASIDMGTNSFKLLIVHADPISGKFLTIDRHKDPVCLGRDTSSSISSESSLRAVTCLKNFHQIIQSNYHVPPHHTKCVATSAVREAENKDGFLETVMESTGLEVVVLSGEEEGRFVYLGVLQFLPVFYKRVLVVDIGGGSTEFVVGEFGKVVFGVSLNLGHVGLTQKFGDSVVGMREFVRKTVKDSGLIEKVMECGFEVAVGSSGTIRAIERAVFCGYGEDLSGYSYNDAVARDCGRDWKFSRGELRNVVERLCKEGERERVTRDAFFKRRSEFIVAGAVLLEEIFEVLGIEEMEVSGFALGEGVIVETLSSIFKNYDLTANVRWQSIVRLAIRFNDKKRVKSAAKCADIARGIFICLRNWIEAIDNQAKCGLNLDVKDLECLEAACLLHNIGLFTGKRGYHKQSYHIIMNRNHLHGYSVEEVKFIALLTRHHRKKFPKSDCETLKEIPKELRQKFKILCAVTRLSIILEKNDCLDFQHVELLHSDEGFELAFWNARHQGNLHVAEDVDKQIREELENLKMATQ